jgi:hypothetical protein
MLSVKILKALQSLKRMEKQALESIHDTSTSSTSTSLIWYNAMTFKLSTVQQLRRWLPTMWQSLW